MVNINKVFLNLGIAFISYFFGFDNIRASENKDQPERGYSKPVSYTHLTLPTILRV